MNILTIAALIAAVLATVIIISCYRKAKIPPDEKEDTEKALKDLHLNQKLKPISYTKDELVGYDSHVTINEHPYFSGEYYSSN